MKALLTAPFIPITKNISSHRAAQGVIYADQLRQAGIDVTVNMSMELYHADHNQFDALYVYHGNDWSGRVNLFGGMIKFPYAENVVNFSKFKGKVYSILIDFPWYHSEMKRHFSLAEKRGEMDKIDKRWLDVDIDNLLRMEKESTTVDPNMLVLYDKIVMGDSHAISMYRPGWMMNSVPYKTLHGALKVGLDSFYNHIDMNFTKLEYYFGNIDIRHHLMRRENPEQATRDLVRQYFDAADALNKDVRIYEPLPIENPSRIIPRTGWYDGSPYYGTWEERNEIRNIFIDEAEKSQTKRVHLYHWTGKLKNNLGELDFKCMELPKSVHLSRAYYPWWQGLEYNNLKSSYSLESLFDE